MWRADRNIPKATTILLSYVLNYIGKYVTAVTALKRKVPCLKKTDTIFKGKEIGNGVSGLVKSGCIRSEGCN